MNSVERIRYIVRHLSWMPLSTLEVVGDVGSYPSLIITLKVFDTYNPSEPTAIVTGYAIPRDFKSDEHALKWIRNCLRAVALHECDEWIVFAGQRPFDPHAVAR